MFDDGVLNEDPRLAREEVDSLMLVMQSPNPPIYSASEHPLRYVFQSVWQRIVKVRFIIFLTLLHHIRRGYRYLSARRFD